MLRRLARNLYDTAAAWYLAPLLRREWMRSGDIGINERPIEYAFALRWLWRLCPASVLDVGTGKSSWPHLVASCGFHVTATDQKGSYWTDGPLLNRHYHVVTDDITHTRLSGPHDLITCLSVVEHIDNHADAVRSMLRLLSKGGHLLMTFPYNECTSVDDAYRLPESGYGRDLPSKLHVFCREEIDAWFADEGAHIVDQEYYELFTGELFTVGRRLRPPRKVGRTERHHLMCLLVQHQ